MSRRLEIELTSERPDGTWTWRAAGARQPKGELSGSVLHAGAKVGDVLRAEADFAIDGIEILSVLPPKAARKEPERLVVVGTRTDEPLVTTQLAPKGRGARREGGRRDGGRREGRRDRDGGRERRDRDSGDRRPRGDRPRGPRPDPVPERPKPKRLRPARTHRSAVLDDLAPEQRPIAEQVLRGGVPAVREAIAKQNEQARKENRPEVPSEQLLSMAEQLLPRLRAAEWRDKAEAALADLDELDLRDLRSVVVAADGNTRDEASRGMLQELQDGLARRVEQDQANWISDIEANLDAGRFVRALRLSSRPPKAGAPLPPELATKLINAVSAGLTPSVNQDLWAAAVDALAFSPVRNQVVPAGRPEAPSDTLLDAVKRFGDRLPAMVELFGLDPAEVAAAAKRRSKGTRRSGTKPSSKQRDPKKPSDESVPDGGAPPGDPEVAPGDTARAESATSAEAVEDAAAPAENEAPPAPEPEAAEDTAAPAENEAPPAPEPEAAEDTEGSPHDEGAASEESTPASDPESEAAAVATPIEDEQPQE